MARGRPDEVARRDAERWLDDGGSISSHADQDPHTHEQPLVVGNGLPVKTKSDSGLTQRRET